MAVATSAEALQDLERVIEALASACVYVAGHDQADSVRDGLDKPRNSALQTLLAQAQKGAERTRAFVQALHVEPCMPPLSDLGHGKAK